MGDLQVCRGAILGIRFGAHCGTYWALTGSILGVGHTSGQTGEGRGSASPRLFAEVEQVCSPLLGPDPCGLLSRFKESLTCLLGCVLDVSLVYSPLTGFLWLGLGSLPPFEHALHAFGWLLCSCFCSYVLSLLVRCGVWLSCRVFNPRV